MWKSDASTGTIKATLPKVFAQESTYGLEKKRINKRSVTSSTYVQSDYIRHQGKAFEKEIILPYRLYEKNVGKIIRAHRLAIKLENKYKKEFDELRKRLHVIDDLQDSVMAVTDIDDNYFKYFKNCGRTVYIPLYKSLGFVWNKQLRLKQEIGYRQDAVLRMEIVNNNELQMYETSVEKYTQQVKQFDKFIYEDYTKSIESLRKAEMLFSSKIIATVLDLENLASMLCLTQSQLLGIDYLYYTQQKYGRFLYYLSPPSWRANHRDFAHSVEIETKGFDLGVSSDEDTFFATFEKLRNECSSGLIKPVLYFSRPQEVMTIFETLEKQQLHHFTHVVRLHPVTEHLKREIKYLKLCIQNDSNFVANVIEDIEKLIHFNEERACELNDKFMKIMYGLFHDSVAATDVLKLKMNLEWCYEKLFMEKSTTTLLSTAKAMEDMYMKYTYELESISYNEITKALNQSITEEKNTMKKAKLAAKELRLFYQLEKSLLRAYDKNKVKVTPVANIMRPSTRKLKESKLEFNTTKRRSSQRVLTDAEIEYLCLFTNWTEKENPAKYLQSY